MATSLIKESKRGARLGQLSNQQRMFVKHLLADPSFNLTKAARNAGYTSPRQAGAKLIKHRAISAAVGKEIRIRSEKLEFTAQEVLERLKTILAVDLTDIYDEEGHTTMEQVKKLPEMVRQCITKIRTIQKSFMNDMGEREYYNVVELQWMSKDQALTMAMRHFGLIEPELQVHVVNDQIKAQIMIDLLTEIGKQENVIDGKAIEKLAEQA